MYIDVHSHLYDPSLNEYLEVILSRHPQANLVWASASIDDISAMVARYRQVMRSHRQAKIELCLGLHPQQCFQYDSTPSSLYRDIAILQAYLDVHSAETVALGEIGLDRAILSHHPAAKRNDLFQIQLELLRLQIELALKRNLPIILHCVKAHGAMIGELRQRWKGSGLVHSFQGSRECLADYLSLGMYISFPAGTIKRVFSSEGSDAQREHWIRIVRACPSERLLVETDSCKRINGALSIPCDALEIAQILSHIKGLQLDEMLNQTKQNWHNLTERRLK